MPAESFVGTISFTRSGSPIGARVSSPKNVLGPIRRAIQKFQHRAEVSVAHLLSKPLRLCEFEIKTEAPDAGVFVGIDKRAPIDSLDTSLQVLQQLLQFDPSIGGISCGLVSDRVAGGSGPRRSKHLKRLRKR
jgi:hypothetical protein